MVNKDTAIPQGRMQIKKVADNMIMVFAFIVMFASLAYREEVGTALDVVLGPFADFIGEFLIIILILSVVTGIYTSVVQKYTMNWELMAKSKEYQKQIRDLQKEYMEAKKENNQHKMKKIEKKRTEVMRKQTQFSGEMFKQQMKPMAYIMIITIPIFMWIWMYVESHPDMVVTFPLFGVTELSSAFVFSLPFWVLWYMMCSIPLTQVVRKALGIRSGM
ncbi:MAG: EMC3/TMCO1 family protein [Euryarchaeota archaeon]|nr:EMC3/TMCO1 family protein [Euryarchaeota archaeon]